MDYKSIVKENLQDMKIKYAKKQEEFDKQQKEKSRLILKERESFNNHLIELNDELIKGTVKEK